MSKRVSKSAPETDAADAPRDMFSEAMAMQTQWAATAAHFQAKVMEEAADATFDIFDFFNSRLGQDIEATRALSQCESIETAMERLAEFQRKALEDYTCEGARLSARGTHVSDALTEEVAEDAEVLAKSVRGARAA